MRFSIPDMSCDHCKAKIEDAILDADEGAELTFDMDARALELETTLSDADAINALKGAGFSARVHS